MWCTSGNHTYLFGTTESLAISAVDAANRTVTVSTAMTEDDARALTGRMVDVSAKTTVTNMCVERVDVASKKITFRWMPDSTVSADWTTANSAKIIPTGGGASGVNVYGTLIYGQDAFGNVELGGNGKNVKVIINPPGSAGAADPLEQRGSIAWKVRGFTCVILQDSFLVRLEHSASV